MKKTCSFIGGVFLILILTFSSCSSSLRENPYKYIPSVRYYPENYNQMDLPEYRLDLVRFHHTIECEECFLIGEAILDLLHRVYAKELEQGLVTYRAVNSEYLENKPLLLYYGVMEEDFVSHFISPATDEIKQYHDLWLIAQNKEQLSLEISLLLEQLLSQLKKELET